MMQYDRRVRVLAACFSCVAGYVDSIGFLMTGGFFVSFMSGNSTRLGIGLADGSSTAGFAAALVVAHGAGELEHTIGVLVGIRRPELEHRRSRQQPCPRRELPVHVDGVP